MLVNEKKIDAMGTISSSEATIPNLRNSQLKTHIQWGNNLRSVGTSVLLYKLILTGSAHLLELEILYFLLARGFPILTILQESLTRE